MLLTSHPFLWAQLVPPAAALGWFDHHAKSVQVDGKPLPSCVTTRPSQCPASGASRRFHAARLDALRMTSQRPVDSRPGRFTCDVSRQLPCSHLGHSASHRPSCNRPGRPLFAARLKVPQHRTSRGFWQPPLTFLLQRPSVSLQLEPLSFRLLLPWLPDRLRVPLESHGVSATQTIRLSLCFPAQSPPTHPSRKSGST